MDATITPGNRGAEKKTCRALFRWQGGKQRLRGRITDLFPLGIGRYIEPFVGAGSVIIEMRSRGFKGSAFLGDWNAEVVNVHRIVAADPDGFEAAYRFHFEMHCREHFNWLRNQDASGWTSVERAARFVYIAKAAFHGLVRVDRRGRIISTYGTGEPGRVRLDGDRIRAVSAALREADIRHGDFGWVSEVARPGDLVFLDPPYFGGNCAYVADGFGEDDHRRLLRLCRALDARGVHFLQTNSDRPFVRDLYRGYRMLAVPPAPAIGRGRVGRQPVGDVIIANYDPVTKAKAFEVAA